MEAAEISKDSSDDNRKKEAKSDVVPYYKLFAFADSIDLLLMVTGTITAIGSGLSMPLQTLIFGELIDTFGGTTDKTAIVHLVSKVSLKYVYLALGAGVAAFAQVVCWMVTGERQAARIRSLYLKTILRQDVGFFDQEGKTGEIVERMSGDTVIIQDAMGEKVGKFIQLTSTFFGGFVIAFSEGWLLALVLLSSIPLLVISAAFMTVVMTKLMSRGQAAYSAGASVVEQTISSIRTVASFTGEKEAIAKYEKSLRNAYRAGVQEGLVAGIGSGIFMMCVFCCYSLAIWFGGRLIIEKGYSGGQVINVMIAVLISSFSLGQASPCLSAFASGRVAGFKLFQVIDRKSEIDPYDTRGRKLEDIHGDIELRDITFSYPARPQEKIFNGFSLAIPSGTTAALVGQSGSGKSTVISLLQRFYDPQKGEVVIDDINIKEYHLRWLRGKIGLVSQEPVLFTSTIRDNIAYGKDDATLHEIKAAAGLANATKFIDKFPQGLDTMVGDHGTHMSGGQKQRIAIARAILKDPRILLLDEATSALDAESERVVQEALDRIMVNRTTVIVAHRLTTIQNSDLIAVIHHGKIVEKGSHSELLQDPEGAYSQLIRLQELNKDSEKQEADITVTAASRESSNVGNSNRHSVSTAVSSYFEELKPDQNQPDSHTSSDVSLLRLAYLNKPEILVILLGSIAAVVNGAILPIFGYLLSNIIKIFFKPADELRKESDFWALMLLVLGFASLIATPLRTYFFGVAGCKLIRRIRLRCFQKVVQMEISWFDKAENASGLIGAKLSADAASVRGLVGDTVSLLVQNTATAVAGLLIAFLGNWQLALIILVMLPLIGLNGYLQLRFISGFSADTKKLYEDASQVASDAVGSIRTVASFCAEEKVMKLYEKKCESPRRAGIQQGLVSGFGFGLSMFLLFVVYATSFYVGARFVAAGKTTFPKVFQVFLGLSMAAMGVSQSGSFVPDSGKAKTATASVFGLLDQKSKIDYTDESGTTLQNVKGDIEFNHVNFKYPSRPDIEIFRDFCLTIPSGKTIALVGESGSGKSTVVSLLQRFYDVDFGRITLDGFDIQKLNVKWLRQQMGLVSQEPVLFNDTIRANIAYGKEGNATEAEVLAAAELANAHKFVSALHQGYDTTVGERGIQLSGGQKQRVAIARAIIKAPKILLLDEATSALDAESEKVVQDALDRVILQQTTVVVAHRLSTIRGADVIVVVKNGMIAEKGKHEKLINMKDGIYASLVALHTNASN
ncbi:ABC transporter B family member 11-like [Cynara cardunculus var. scolymus]|uniref:ABC transporter B family member 11-like n=1 Tax=Cynara cardunculus var. scolymus TaxID=59895 RepID=UPI000D62C318|nr:ABC transporter B family member 11-like [Cynara cardunculus var. scolymus]